MKLRRILPCLALSLALTAYAAVASFGPTGEARLGVTTTSARVILSTTGTPTAARVTNLGSQTAFVLLGTSTVTVTSATGLVLTPGESIYLTLGSNTYIAGITNSGTSALAVDLGS